MTAPNRFSFTSRYKGRSRVLQNDIQVFPPFDPSGQPQPDQWVTAKATWDTGATNTVINERVVSELGLSPIGLVRVAHAHGMADAEQYLVNIRLPNSVGIPHLVVTKGQLTGCDVLVGMDIIGSGDFAVTHHQGNTTFSFRMPSCEEIDFVKSDLQPAHSTKISRNSPCPCGSGKKYKHCHGI